MCTEQVDAGINEARLSLRLVRCVQQQGAQVAGVFKAPGLQLEVPALGILHFATIVRSDGVPDGIGPILALCMCAFN